MLSSFANLHGNQVTSFHKFSLFFITTQTEKTGAKTPDTEYRPTYDASCLLGVTRCPTLLCATFLCINLNASALMSLAMMFFTPGISKAYLTERRPEAAKASRIVIPTSAMHYIQKKLPNTCTNPGKRLKFSCHILLLVSTFISNFFTVTLSPKFKHFYLVIFESVCRGSHWSLWHYDFTMDKVCLSLKFITQPVVIEPKPFDFGYKS